MKLIKHAALCLLLSISGQQLSAMGTDYYIIPDRKTSCPDEFSNGLSFFFEQVGGYGETAEVEQVSSLLKLNLSVFQDVGYDYENPDEIKMHWHDIDSISGLLDVFVGKIRANPEYYKKVLHNPDREKQLDEEERIWKIADTAERYRQLNQLREKPFYFYPPDYGYLSEGRLLGDLKMLQQTLACYKRNGVTKIRFQYF